MHEKEFEAKRQQPLLAVYSQSGVKSFYLDQQGSSISFFWVQATHPSLGVPCLPVKMSLTGLGKVIIMCRVILLGL